MSRFASVSIVDRCLSAVAGSALLGLFSLTLGPARADAQMVKKAELGLSTVSARQDMISGGDVLVRVDIPAGMSPDGIVVERDGADVTAAFRPGADGRALLGLIRGLSVGNHELSARPKGQAAGRVTLKVTNHPIAGPIIAGPHEEPFFCTTQSFELVTGATLGPALGDGCWVPSRIDYVYRTTDGTVKPLADLKSRPADLAFTTTMDGQKVPYIVRVETGTINRAIYEIAMLHDPAGPVPDPWTSNPSWNGRLIYRFGGGCREGWHTQGTSTDGVLDNGQLSRGYAIASATLNVFGNNCSDLLATETMMMVKERFIEAYGPPRFTIGWGSSGGSHQQHGIGDNYPGLLDGLMVGQAFSDVTTTVFKLVDGRLLEHYFKDVAPGLFNEEQQRAVSGFGILASIPNQSDGAGRVDADAEFQDAVPLEARYNAVTNPGGARGTVFDHTVNVYGRDPQTGFALRPLDNVGVQYGLATLNAGVITKEQFLDLNERIGGLDRDANHQAERIEGDLPAIRAAYRTGRITWGGGGLASVPIIDYRGYVDMDKNGNNHMRVHSFVTRARLQRANGNADNQVILIRDSRFGFSGNNEVLYDALAQMDQWLVNIAHDPSSDPQAIKVGRAKPKELVDACWTPEGEKIAERQSFDGTGRCNELFRPYPLPRMVAGGPLTEDIVKCQLKPIDAADYKAKFTPAEWSKLKEIFPTGVCDWSRPGVGQQPSETWLRMD